MSSSAATRLEILQSRFDGAIPERLKDGRPAVQLEIEQHEGMIRFARERIESFSAQLTEIQAWPDSAPGKAAWLTNTQQIIDEHTADIARHQAALDALRTAEQVAA